MQEDLSGQFGRDNLIFREGLCVLALMAGFLLLSTFLDAPAPEPPGAVPPAAIRAPWFFLGIQYLLRFFPPLWAGILLPAGLLALLAWIPFLYPRQGMDNPPGRWPRAARLAFFLVGGAGSILTLAAYLLLP